ncbi:MAG: hypothetical protein ACOC3V_00460 [bacterium]
MADIKKIIKDIKKGFGDSPEDKSKILQLFKGLIFSEEEKAKEFVKKLDQATTKIADEVLKQEESIVTIQEDVEIIQDDKKIILEKGDKIRVLDENPEEDMRRAKNLLQHYIDKYNDDPIKVRQTILNNLVNSRYNRPSNDFIQIIWELYNQHYPS